jgi:hypothetical protein
VAVTRKCRKRGTEYLLNGALVLTVRAGGLAVVPEGFVVWLPKDQLSRSI